MEFPKIYVIIVWFNGSKWVHRNLNSLLKSNLPVNIICVDNCSTDNTFALLQDFSNDITLIQTKSNLGFGKANNIALELALKDEVDFVFLLNQDTWIYPETIENLVNIAQQNSDFGILSPMHLAPNEKDLDINFNTYLSKAFDRNDSIIEVPFVNAAAWLIPLVALQKVSYFEPLFGHYGEDRNFVDRMQFHNYKIGIIEQAKITHDRTVVRNFNKDIIQCQYKILSILLNPNLSENQAKKMALKNVIGLPKYFFKFYGLAKSFQLFLKLNSYFKTQMSNWVTIQKARNSY